MFWQVIKFLLLLLLGAVLGYLLSGSSSSGAGLGLFLVAISWLIFEQYKRANLLRWLQNPDFNVRPTTSSRKIK